MRIFFKKNLDNFWTNYHVIFPYIDEFNTYIVTRAWNIKPSISHSIFIQLLWNLQKSNSQPHLHLKSRSYTFLQSRCPLALMYTNEGSVVFGNVMGIPVLTHWIPPCFFNFVWLWNTSPAFNVSSLSGENSLQGQRSNVEQNCAVVLQIAVIDRSTSRFHWQHSSRLGACTNNPKPNQ